MDKELIGIVAGIISLIAYTPYIYSIFQHETKPSRSSWWIWSFIGLIILISYYYAGARNTIWIPVVFFICPFIIALLSLRFGEGSGLTALDKICILGTAISLIPWIIFKSASMTLFLNIFTDFLGFLPTIHKTFLNPLHENKTTWILFFFGSILNVAAVESFSVQILVYPLYMLALDVVILALLFRKSFIISKK